MFVITPEGGASSQAVPVLLTKACVPPLCTGLCAVTLAFCVLC